MSRNAKIALVVVGALVVMCSALCIGGYIIFQRTIGSIASQSPEDTQRIAAGIADYTVPEGYEQVMGMDLFVYKMVAIAPENQNVDNGMMFMLMGTSVAGVNQADMERQMQQSFQQQYGRSGSTMEYVGQERYNIRGEEVTFNLSESRAEGSPVQMRQAIGTFNGKNGLVIVMMMGASNTWDEALIREFLGSIQ